MAITGTGFVPASVVQFNGSARTTAFVSSTQLQAAITAADIATAGMAHITVQNPQANGGISAASTFLVGSSGGPGFATFIVNQPAQRLLYDARHQVIYATVPNGATANANTISVLDLNTLTITSSVSTGSNPNVEAISDDDQFLYVGVVGSVKRFRLPGLTPDISYSLGTDVFGNPFTTGDLQVAPGAPHTSVINNPLRIFDDATPRPVSPTGNHSFDSLQWGPDATTLFSTGTAGATDFLVLSVNASGATLQQDIQGGGGGNLHYDRGANLFYEDNGDAVTSSGLPAGNFNTFGAMVPDSTLNKAFFLPDTIGDAIESFSLPHFTPIATIGIGGLNGFINNQLIRWGRDGLAFTTSGGQIVLVAGNFLDPLTVQPVAPITIPTPTPTPTPTAQTPAIGGLNPSVAIAGGADFTLTVTGQNFLSNSVLQFNGLALPTTLSGPAQLQATVPASAIASVGVARITVANPVASGGTSAPVSFLVGNTSVNGNAVAEFNLFSKDIAFDPVRQVFYLTVPSTQPDGNSIDVFDLGTGQVIGSQFAGSNPTLLAITDDNQFLYTSLDGAVGVQRFKVAGLLPDVEFALGNAPVFGAPVALDIQPAPGQPHTVAVSSATQSGISIFDDGVPRPTSFSTFFSTQLNSLQWNPDATQLFAGGTDLVTLAVTASGVTQNKDVAGLFGGGRRIHLDNGTGDLYSDGGRIADPSSATLVGTIKSSGLMVPDSSLNAAFFLSGASLQLFNLTRLTAASSITIPGVIGQPQRLLRWGQNGLAFNTNAGQLFLVAGPLISQVPNNPLNPAPLPTPAPTPAPTAVTPAIATLSPGFALKGGGDFTLTVNGSNFDPAATVQWNGSPRATTFVSSTQLQASIVAADIASAGVATVTVANPAANGGTSAGFNLLIGAVQATSSTGAGFAVTVLNQSANDIVFDPVSNAILLSVPSTDAQLGNTISALDLASQTITSSQFVGSEPNILALSGDNQFLYSGIDGAASVQRLNLPAMTKDINFSLGFDFFGTGPNRASDLQVAPGLPHTIATLDGVPGDFTNLHIFDDGVPRTKVPSTPISIQWGADATSLLALDFGGQNLVTFTVDASGATQNQRFFDGLGGGPRIHFDPGSSSVYSDDGHVVDPVAGLPLGNFNTTTPFPFNLTASMVEDRSLNKAFFLTQPVTGSAHIDSFVLNRLTATGSIDVSGITGAPKRLIRWGQNGLAFNTTLGEIVLIGGNFLDPAPVNPPPAPALPAPTPTPVTNAQTPAIASLSPASAVAGGGPFTLTINGTNFDPAAQVLFNGSARNTTFISSSQLQASIPAGDITKTGASSITVANPISNGGTSPGFTFFTGNTQDGDIGIAILDSPSKDISYDPGRQMIYASVGNSDANGNSIAVVDLSTASIIGSQFAGSNPNLLAISDDSQFLYAGINGTSSVQRFTLSSLGAPDIHYPVPSGIGGGLFFASQLQVAPGAPHTTAVVPEGIGGEFGESVTIFDDATARPNVGASAQNIAWGSDSTTLFATAFPFGGVLTFAVGPTGAIQNNSFAGVGFGNIHFNGATQRIFSDSGLVSNITSGSPAGLFQISGPMVANAGTNTAYFATTVSGGTEIKAFDLTHFTPAGSITVGGTTGNVERLLGWGSNGLAFNTTGGQIVILSGNLPVAPPFPAATPIPTPAPTPAPGAQTPAIASLNPGSAASGGPAFTMTVNGSNFIATSTINLNGSPRTTIFVSPTQLTATINAADIASAGTSIITVDNGVAGGVSAGSTFFVGAVAGTTPAGASFAINTLAQPANDLLFDPVNQVFFVAVPSTAAAHGNTVSALDLSGNVISSQFAGSEPDVLALSGDSQFIYAGNHGSDNVQRIALPAMTTDVSYLIGSDPNFGPFFPLDIEIAPGSPHTAAVVGAGAGSPSARGGITIFDDATPRPTQVPGTAFMQAVQWGTDASTMFSIGQLFSDFATVGVNASGATITHDFSNVLTNITTRIHFDPVTNLVYADDGQVINPATGVSTGRFITPSFFESTLMVPDASTNKAYFITQSFNNPTVLLQSFNLKTMAPIDSVTIINVSGNIERLVRWGQNGLAFNTSGGQVFLIGGTLVN